MAIPKKLPVASEPIAANAIEKVLIGGDLSALTETQRISYYTEVCKSLGLNPLTRPLEYIKLNGRLTLYARRDCADQLRRKHGVSIEVLSRDIESDVLTVHVRARLPDGRIDEDLGSVPFPNALKGEARSNQEMKAITKAKRRVTLSICGLGFLDEIEVESVQGNGALKTIAVEQPHISQEQQNDLRKLMEQADKDWPYLASKLSPLQGNELSDVGEIESRHFDRVVSHLKLIIEGRFA